jgi:hypothetical protein
VDVEEWACTNQKICVGKYAGKGGGGGSAAEGSPGGMEAAKDAAMKDSMGLDGGSGTDQLKAFIKAQVSAVVGELKSEVDNHRMDFEILDTSLVRTIGVNCVASICAHSCSVACLVRV